MIQLKDDKRELLRSELYQMANDIKKEKPDASAQEIRDLLKDLIDVSV